MFEPGAEMSGFIRPSRVGPLLLYEAIESSVRKILFISSIAPTPITLNAPAGSLTVPLVGPPFPAETTTGVYRLYAIASK